MMHKLLTNCISYSTADLKQDPTAELLPHHDRPDPPTHHPAAEAISSSDPVWEILLFRPQSHQLSTHLQHTAILSFSTPLSPQPQSHQLSIDLQRTTTLSSITHLSTQSNILFLISIHQFAYYQNIKVNMVNL